MSTFHKVVIDCVYFRKCESEDGCKVCTICNTHTIEHVFRPIAVANMEARRVRDFQD